VAQTTFADRHRGELKMQTRYRTVLSVACLALIPLHIARAQAADVTITATTGSVTILQAGHAVPAVAAAKLALPLEVQTGVAGTVDLLQLGSTVHIGPNSDLILPGPASPQGLVDKILQKAGYVLYNIKSRKDHPLAVETPYLVSVVKGTVFTIAVQDHGTTVALMEGSLDISAPGVSGHVLLKPNESIHHADGEGKLTAHPTAAAALVAPVVPNSLRSTAIPDSGNSAQMAQVAQDFANAGAAVAPGALVALAHAPAAPQLSSPSTSDSSGSTTSGSGNTPGASVGSTGPAGTASSSSTTGASGASAGADSSSGTTSASSGTTGTGSSAGNGSSSGSAAGASGSSSSGSTVASSGGTSGGSAGSGGQSTASSGSAGSNGSSGTIVPVTLPGITVTVGCNGKTNGTGKGKCLGHGKGKGG